MILKQGHKYEPMPHDGKTIWRIYRGGRCYYKDSPYSLAATQALKAAFPQYWTAIRDYGYAHPQLVPFINEDPMLIVSLVEVGKVRKLESDGVAYIDTGISADTPLMSFECLADMTGLTTYPKSLFGTIGGYGPGSGMYGIIYHGQGGIGFRVGMYNSNYVSTGLNAQSTNAHILGIVGDSEFELFVDGVSKGTKAKGTPASKPMYLFGTWIDSSNSKTNSRIAFIRFFTDTDLAHFIPMQRTDGTCGMLDIVSLTFHPNANTQGAFTIQVTDKA